MKLLVLRIWVRLSLNGKEHMWYWDKRYEYDTEKPVFTDDFILKCVQKHLGIDISEMIDKVNNFGNPEFDFEGQKHLENKYSLELNLEKMSPTDINNVLLCIHEIKTEKLNPEKVGWDLLKDIDTAKEAINPKDYHFPKEMLDYIGDESNLFKSISGNFNGPSMIELRSASNLKLIDVEFGVDDEHIIVSNSFFMNDPNKGDHERMYKFQAIDLIRENDLYQSEGLLIWIPELKKFGTYDPEHLNLLVFPDAEAKDVISNFGKYIEAQWSYGPDYSIKCGNIYDYFEPWKYFSLEETTPKFKDLNFKIAVIGALQALGYYCEEAEKIQNDNADWDKDHEPIPAVLEFYTNLEIKQEYLNEIEALQPDGGSICYQYLLNEWDGEDTQFDISSIEGIENLNNLKHFEPISMIVDSGVDYSPLLLCEKLEYVCSDYINENGDEIIEELKNKGIKIISQKRTEDKISPDKPEEFDINNPKILVFYLNEFEEIFGKLEMVISKTVYDSPFYIYDQAFKHLDLKFENEKDINDEDYTTGFDILKKIWVDHVSQYSPLHFDSLFQKKLYPNENKFSLSPTYGFVPGYDLNAAIETIQEHGFQVIRWDEYWKQFKSLYIIKPI